MWGAVLGSSVITVSNQWLRDWLPQIVGQAGNYETIVFGVLMIVILQRAPDGPVAGAGAPDARQVRAERASIAAVVAGARSRRSRAGETAARRARASPSASAAWSLSIG